MSALRQLVRTSGRRARRQAEAMTMSDTTPTDTHTRYAIIAATAPAEQAIAYCPYMTANDAEAARKMVAKAIGERCRVVRLSITISETEARP